MPVNATSFHGPRHLSETDLLPLSNECPICLSKAPRKAAVRVQSMPDVDFLVCSNCRGASASRMPSSDALNSYYSAYYDPDATERITFSSPQRLAKLVVSHLLSKDTSRVRILDIGGGDGTIALHCARRLMGTGKARRVEIIVVDAVIDSASAPPPGVELSFTSEMPAEGAFDIVLASAVLEHIPQMRTAFDAMLGKLAPGGVFYARTPYVLPFAKRISVNLTYPAHVHDIGAACWSWLFRHAPVRIEEVLAGPSIVETTLRTNPQRATAAHILKTPARILAALGAPAIWPYYGGWQVIWRRLDA